MAERAYWKEYQKAFEDTLSATSTKHAPWHVIPADEKHVAHALVAAFVVKAIQDLGLRTPTLPKKERSALRIARKQLGKG